MPLNLLLASSLALIPQPKQSLECRAIVFKPDTVQLQIKTDKILVDQKVTGVLEFSTAESLLRSFLADQNVKVKPSTGFQISIVPNPKIKNPEAYKLQMMPGGIRIEASSDRGAYYGVQSLAQLWSNSAQQLPCVSIQDEPRMTWRGLHLDVARHFHDSASVVRILDFMALHKLNTFHWHLSDDQGWRVEIPSYPRLTSVGAWRVDRSDQPWTQRTPASENEKASYGGFYTQAQIRGIVAEAAKRNITIVPEIDIPAHMAAVLAAYPSLSCTGKYEPVPVGNVWPENRVLCPGRDSTLIFLREVTTEVAKLFPGPWFHLGGDEADRADWEKDSLTLRKMHQLGLKSSAELQGWMHSTMAQHLAKLGKKVIGWDEVLEHGPLPKNSAVMAWHGQDFAARAMAMGNPAILSLEDELYFDHSQDPSPDEPKTIGGSTTLRDVFALDIKPAPQGKEDLLLGIQGQLWSEYLSSRDKVDYMLFPRISALSERAWSPAPQGDLQQNYQDFLRRLVPLETQLLSKGAKFERQGLRPDVQTLAKPGGELEVKLIPALPEYSLRCLWQKSADWSTATACDAPQIIKDKSYLQAAAFVGDQRFGKALRVELTAHQALGLEPKISAQISDKFNGKNPKMIVDGRLASSNFGDGKWLGQEGEDFVVEFDLPAARPISQLEVGFLHDPQSWIFAPQEIVAQISMDGKTFVDLARMARPSLQEKTVWRPILKGQVQNAKSLRLVIRAQKTCPVGHVGAGGKSWTFVDEVEWR